jgi:hypothetical protein
MNFRLYFVKWRLFIRKKYNIKINFTPKFRIQTKLIRTMSSTEALTYNPENPYIFNEHYFENTSHVIYKETFSYMVLRTSFALSTASSLFLIGLILYLIAFKTSKSFRSYSKALLICALSDIYIILCDFCCQIVGYKLNCWEYSIKKLFSSLI